MEHLIELARRLGKQIAAHQRTDLLKKAQILLRDDAQARQLLEDYRQQVQHIHDLEKDNKPIEVEDKKKLQEIETRIAAEPALAELTRRQADFVEMMHKVKAAIDSELQF